MEVFRGICVLVASGIVNWGVEESSLDCLCCDNSWTVERVEVFLRRLLELLDLIAETFNFCVVLEISFVFEHLILFLLL